MKKLFFTILFCLFTATCFAQQLSKPLVKDKDKQLYRTQLGEDLDEVIIGDELSTDTVNLKPKIKFTVWKDKNGIPENSLSLIISDNLITDKKPKLKNNNKTLEIGDDKTGFYFEPQDDGINFKFGLILYSQPDPKYLITIDGKQYYQWNFQLEGWEDYNFSYNQPLLDKDGNEVYELNGFVRQEGTNGAWLVTHKTKRDHIIGKTNYMVGIVGIFLRPVFIDAIGKQINSVLNIKDGVYNITIPQDFLNTAVYPIKANDTWGQSNTPTDYNAPNEDNVALLIKPGTSFPGGDISKLTIWTAEYYSGDWNGKALIYSDTGAAYPNVRLGVGTVVASSDTQNWYDYPFSSPVTVAAGVTWIGVVTSSWGMGIGCTSGTGVTKWKIDSYASPSSPFPAGATSQTWYNCIYATYVGPAVDQKNFQFFNAGDELPHWDYGTCPVIETADVTGSGNDTAETSPDVAYPAHSSGDLLIQVLANDADSAQTPPANGPNGETINTILTDTEPGGTAGPHLSVIYWIASTNTNAGTLIWTLNPTEQWDGHCIRVPAGEFDATTPIDSISAAGLQTSGTGATIDTPAFACIRASGRVVAVGGVDTDPMNATFSPAGWTDVYDNDRGATTSWCAIRDAATTAGENIAGASFGINTGDTAVCVAFVVNAPGRTADGRTTIGAEGADPELEVDTDYGWQFRLENPGMVNDDEYKLQYKLNAGSWTDITDTSSVVKANLTADFANGDDVPQYIEGSEAYTTNNNAALESTGALTLGTNFATNYAFEGHLNFQIVSGDVVDNDTIQLRVVYGDGDTLETYTDTPTITVSEVAPEARGIILIQ